jgi:hypothetical protein
MFYVLLRGYGLRAHVARNVYEQALALVKASRENRWEQADSQEAFS